MKKIILFLTLSVFISTPAISQENSKTDSLQRTICTLQAKIDSLKIEIQEDILKNGYIITAKCKYSYSSGLIKLKEKEYGSVIDTIRNGDIIKIIDKTTSCFKVVHNDKEGYIDTYEIDIAEYPSLNILEPSSIRAVKINSRSNTSSSYSSGSSGSVSVKGYYRKDGTYVRPHTRSAPRRK